MLDVRPASGRLDNAVGGRIPDRLFGSIHLPPLGPVDPTLFSLLRRAHTLLALLLF